jgi:hypothetical protein
MYTYVLLGYNLQHVIGAPHLVIHRTASIDKEGQTNLQLKHYGYSSVNEKARATRLMNLGLIQVCQSVTVTVNRV